MDKKTVNTFKKKIAALVDPCIKVNVTNLKFQGLREFPGGSFFYESATATVSFTDYHFVDGKATSYKERYNVSFDGRELTKV